MRLGDLDALKQRMCEICNRNYSDEPCDPSDCVFCNAIKDSPTIDAVPVVRCRECSFWKKQEWSGASKLGDPLQQGGGCSLHKFGALENDFCSRGKRKEADHEVSEP